MVNTAFAKLRDANRLPSPAGVALEILRLTGDANVAMEAITAVVETDPALAGRLLKLVNSPFAGLSRRIASISAAVRLLGVRAIRNLALTVSLISNYRSGRCQAFDYEDYWSESLARASVARALALHTRGFQPDEAFSVALLSKIGRLGLATAYPKEYSALLSRVACVHSAAMFEAERNAFGIDHNELAALMIAEWRLPDDFCDAVRHHHRPSEARGTASTFALHLHAGQELAAVLRCPPAARTVPEALVEEARALGIDKDALGAILESATSAWREASTVYAVPAREVAPAAETRDDKAPTAADTRATPADGAADEGRPPAAEPLRVLVVDDDPDGRRLVERYLTEAGFRVTTASNGAEALDVDRSEAPQMIITDLQMPVMDGIELCRRLRAHEGVGFVYVIAVTADTTRSRVVEALDAGADDFVSKPYTREELVAHVRAGERIVRLEAKLAERSREVARYNAQLESANDKLRSLASTDELTGLASRREGLARLAEHWALAARHGQPLACVVVDLDHFKRVNDTHGHAMGDAVLRTVGTLLRNGVRAGEVVCRMGGEEFLIVCPRSSAASAEYMAERMRAALAAQTVASDGHEVSVTLSAGVAEKTDAMRSADDLLRAADEALYAAKRAGRNRVALAGGPSNLLAPPSERDAAGAATTRPLGHPSGDDPIRVMIVDDDPSLRALCRRVLEKEGCVVADAADGLAALDQVAAFAPDVIVMDAAMPRIDGLTCTRQLKSGAVTQSIPIIMLSAAGAAGNIESGLEAGADEYMTKPFGHREFVLRVQSMARLHRSKAELVWSNAVRFEQALALQLLLDMSCALSVAQTIDEITERVVRTVSELTSARRVALLLPDADGKHLTVARAIGVDAYPGAFAPVPIEGSVSGRVFLTGESLVINTPAEAVTTSSDYDAQFFARAPVVSKAMCTSERVVGVLNVGERCDERRFQPRELESIELLSNIAATAINDFASRAARDYARDSLVVALATLAEYRDLDTGKHLERVTGYARILAEALRREGPHRHAIDDAFIQDLQRAMPLHDIGKVAVPDHILLKPGRLTDAEMTIMRRHAELGARTIRAIIARAPDAEFLRMAEQIASGHHEWYDGTGYPHGLTGDAIPLAARIAALADVYDALTSRRPYKAPMTPELAGRILRDASGTQFDPAVVDAFIQCEEVFAEVAEHMADDPEAMKKKPLLETAAAPVGA